MLALLLALVCPGCLSAGNNRFQKNTVLFDNMRHKINVIFDNDEVYSLSGIVLLFRMF